MRLTVERSEWARGWPLVLMSSLGIMLSAAFAGGLSTSLTTIEQEMGWSRTAITAGPMIAAAIPLLMGPFSGMLIDRLGPRRIVRISIPLYAMAVASLGMAGPGQVGWFASWAAIGALTPFVGPLVWTIGLSRCFEANRGTAFAFAMSGVGLAHFLTPLISVAMLDWFSWRAVFPAVAGFAFLAVYPLVLLLFRPAASGAEDAEASVELPGMEVREIFTSYCFWVIALVVVLQYGALGTLFVHLQPIYVGAGLDAVAAAQYASTMGIALIIGRLLGGYIVDRVSARHVAAAVTMLPILACVLLLKGPGSPWIALVVPMLVGFSMGSEGDIIAYMTAKYFGPKNFGSAFSIYMALYAVGYAFASVIGGAVYDALGSYDKVLQVIAVALAVAAMLVLTIGRPPQFSLQRRDIA
ncbi:MFS transporter [Rhizorhapis sp. SPR117]|uniref:MFS transporter n=1 Tax=Rhizorhapis sp. SPR117 TaxID=2912611 RepID=UPI001F022945|nr:MFS transporter [Rhizorhapis sp. SPR117]